MDRLQDYLEAVFCLIPIRVDHLVGGLVGPRTLWRIRKARFNPKLAALVLIPRVGSSFVDAIQSAYANLEVLELSWSTRWGSWCHLQILADDSCRFRFLSARLTLRRLFYR